MLFFVATVVCLSFPWRDGLSVHITGVCSYASCVLFEWRKRECSCTYVQGRHPNARQPNVRTVVNAYQRLLDHGSFHARSHSQERGRPALSQNLYDDVLAYFEEDPRRSTNDADRRLNISQSCAWKIINKAGLHPYHYRKSQELTPMDFFLWSEIKRRVHRSERIRLEWLKQRILDAIHEVKRQRSVLLSLKTI